MVGPDLHAIDKALTAHLAECSEQNKHITESLCRLEAQVNGLFARFWKLAVALVAAETVCQRASRSSGSQRNSPQPNQPALRRVF
ncbi:MAG: hypothetical protein NTV97_31255 [Alphaproteobacteria bacterium]|nr:hypothetical protein [Alphaproteobacteria bacterium]